jgi:hypothetical protein
MAHDLIERYYDFYVVDASAEAPPLSEDAVVATVRSGA